MPGSQSTVDAEYIVTALSPLPVHLKVQSPETNQVHCEFYCIGMRLITVEVDEENTVEQ